MKAPEPLAAEFFCMACRTPFMNSFPLDAEGVCGLCRAGLRGFDRAYCYGSYDGPLKELIHLFKYGRAKGLAVPFTKYLSAALPVDAKFDVVVPVPLHWRRRWQRGFNQSEVLGRHIARRRGMRVAKLLVRQRWTGSQASLANSARRTNVTGAFRVRGAVAGLRILLVDDVMTTGATASACAVVLKRAGAKSVTLLTLARVDRRQAESHSKKSSVRNSDPGAS